MCKYVSNIQTVGIYVFKFNKWGIMMRVKHCTELLLYDISKGEIARLPVCYTHGRPLSKAHKARALGAKIYICIIGTPKSNKITFA